MGRILQGFDPNLVAFSPLPPWTADQVTAVPRSSKCAVTLEDRSSLSSRYRSHELSPNSTDYSTLRLPTNSATSPYVTLRRTELFGKRGFMILILDTYILANMIQIMFRQEQRRYSSLIGGSLGNICYRQLIRRSGISR